MMLFHVLLLDIVICFYKKSFSNEAYKQDLKKF